MAEEEKERRGKADTPPQRPNMFKDPPASVKSLRRYYRDRLAVPDKFSLQGELAGESDRSAVILLAALLDDALVFRLLAGLSFEPTANEVEHIFRFEGPLGTFSARMEVAYIFGCIEDRTYADLNVIREMRNACAHSKHTMTFSDDALVNVAKRLFLPGGMMTAEMAEEGLKGAVIVTGVFLYYSLLEGSRQKGYETVREMMRKLPEQSPSPDTPPQQ
jgi:hypothetical protein